MKFRFHSHQEHWHSSLIWEFQCIWPILSFQNIGPICKKIFITPKSFSEIKIYTSSKKKIVFKVDVLIEFLISYHHTIKIRCMLCWSFLFSTISLLLFRQSTHIFLRENIRKVNQSSIKEFYLSKLFPPSVGPGYANARNKIKYPAHSG